MAALLSTSIGWLWPTYAAVVCLPLCATAGTIAMLVRWRRSKSAMLVAAAYLALWISTATIGIGDARALCQSRLVPSDGAWRAIDYDPMDHGAFGQPDQPWPEKPWYFIGNAWSPCPFVVSIDIAIQADPLGLGERALCLWMIDRVWLVAVYAKWNSC